MKKERGNIVLEIAQTISQYLEWDINKVLSEVNDTSSNENKVKSLILLAEKKIPVPRLFDFLITAGNKALNLSVYNEAVIIFTKLYNLSEGIKDYSNYLAEAYYNFGIINFRQSKWTRSERNMLKASGMFSELADYKSQVKCGNVLGALKGEQGELLESRQHLINCLELLEDEEDEYLQAIVDENLGIIYNAQKNFEQAHLYFNRSLMYFHKIEDLRRISEVHYNQGLLFIYREDYNAASREIDQSMTLAQKTKFMPIIALLYLAKGIIYLERGEDITASESFLNKAMNLSLKVNDMMTVADVYRVKGMLARKLKDYKIAGGFLEESLNINKNLNNNYNLAEINYEMGLLYWDIGKKEESKNVLNKALAYKKKINAVEDIKRIQSILSNL